MSLGYFQVDIDDGYETRYFEIDRLNHWKRGLPLLYKQGLSKGSKDSIRLEGDYYQLAVF